MTVIKTLAEATSLNAFGQESARDAGLQTLGAINCSGVPVSKARNRGDGIRLKHLSKAAETKLDSQCSLGLESSRLLVFISLN